MPTSLVTGGAGFLGSHLCDELLSRGHRVICVDNLETGSLRNIAHIRRPEFEFRQVDIVQPFFVDEPVDVVYHAASPASPAARPPWRDTRCRDIRSAPSPARARPRVRRRRQGSAA